VIPATRSAFRPERVMGNQRKNGKSRKSTACTIISLEKTQPPSVNGMAL
jgi:hypothetical protein